MIGVRSDPDSSLVLANQSRGRESIHDWHLAVHQHCIKATLAEQVDCLGAIDCMNGIDAHALKRSRRDKRVDSVVLDKQHRLAASAASALGETTGSVREGNACSLHSGSSRRTVKTLPRPTVLLTRTVPPMAWAS